MARDFTKLIDFIETDKVGIIRGGNVWNCALREEEIKKLYEGVDPRIIRSDCLIFYSPYMVLEQ